MTRGVKALLLGLPVLLAGSGAARAEAGREPLLRFDPFVRPDLAAAAADAPGRPRADGEWRPVLTATLVSPHRSLASLGGVVLEVGQATHGYRLLEVREFEAVFEYAGNRVVLPLTRPRSEP